MDATAGGAGDTVFVDLAGGLGPSTALFSTSRISRADPFPFHPTSNTIPYYILFIALY